MGMNILLSTFTRYQRITCVDGRNGEAEIAFFDDHFSLLHHLSMKKLITLFILLSFISCQGNNGSSSSEERSQNTVQNETLTNKFMILVNNHRKSKGLKTLTNVETLSDIALDHSIDMARKKVGFGHTGFSSRCTQARNALSGNLCAENVAMGQKTAEAVFSAWMNSSSHRANIENPRLTHSGLGIAVSESGTYYWTHLFLEKN
jgi:uncharacterized protein YkwD